MKNSNKKTGIILAVVAVLVIAVIAVIVLIMNKTETYRLVKVDDLNGEVLLLRKGNDTAITKDMRLQPADEVKTLENGTVVLLVDSDKHIAAKENTDFSIEAIGDENSGSVKIVLNAGEALFSIDNKLNENSIFEVNTPNATLSVRGTVFNVVYDKKTNATKLEVREGVVAVLRGDNTDLVQAGETVYITEEAVVTENDYNSASSDSENEAQKTDDNSDEEIVKSEEIAENTNAEENITEEADETEIQPEESDGDTEENTEEVPVQPEENNKNLVSTETKKVTSDSVVVYEVEVVKASKFTIQIQDVYPGDGIGPVIQDASGKWVNEDGFSFVDTQGNDEMGINIMDYTFTLAPGKYTFKCPTLVCSDFPEGYIKITASEKEAFEIKSSSVEPFMYE